MSTPVPVTRTLAAVLRRELAGRGGDRLIIGKVTGIPDSTHVTFEFEGVPADRPPPCRLYPHRRQARLLPCR